MRRGEEGRRQDHFLNSSKNDFLGKIPIEKVSRRAFGIYLNDLTLRSYQISSHQLTLPSLSGQRETVMFSAEQIHSGLLISTLNDTEEPTGHQSVTSQKLQHTAPERKPPDGSQDTDSVEQPSTLPILIVHH